MLLVFAAATLALFTERWFTVDPETLSGYIGIFDMCLRYKTFETLECDRVHVTDYQSAAQVLAPIGWIGWMLLLLHHAPFALDMRILDGIDGQKHARRRVGLAIASTILFTVAWSLMWTLNDSDHIIGGYPTTLRDYWGLWVGLAAWVGMALMSLADVGMLIWGSSDRGTLMV